MVTISTIVSTFLNHECDAQKFARARLVSEMLTLLFACLDGWELVGTNTESKMQLGVPITRYAS